MFGPGGEADVARAGGVDESELGRVEANYRALTPSDLLEWAARTYPDRTAVVHGDLRRTYREFRDRCRRLASALGKLGVGEGSTVSVLAPNVPAMLEAHFGVPMAGAVLNTINTRLDAATVRFVLGHAGTRLFIVDREFAALATEALSGLDAPPAIIDIDDPLGPGGAPLGALDYETLLAGGDPEFVAVPPADEWQAIALNYTSGTTADPKGVVYHHRGAFLNALGNVMMFGLRHDSVYLWTLPMFHCNGWSHTWAVTAAAGTHVCLRRVEPATVFDLIAREGVTHLCGAPVVLNMLAAAPEAAAYKPQRRVEVGTGGAAPPTAILRAMEALGFRVTHLYGLTETYGPLTVCAWQDGWEELPVEEKADKLARQGVAYPTAGEVSVRDPETLEAVPADCETIGEIMVRGHTVMRGYLDNARATGQAFAGGWFHTGDLATVHPDGYLEIKDRAKDVIISGGENISSLEVEEVLYRHPAILEAAVVARPDPKWGESPCAFVTLRPGAGEIGADDIIAWCRDHLAHFKAPRHVVFGELPKTSTGKIQKFVLRERAAAP